MPILESEKLPGYRTYRADGMGRGLVYGLHPRLIPEGAFQDGANIRFDHDHMERVMGLSELTSQALDFNVVGIGEVMFPNDVHRYLVVGTSDTIYHWDYAAAVGSEFAEINPPATTYNATIFNPWTILGAFGQGILTNGIDPVLKWDAYANDVSPLITDLTGVRANLATVFKSHLVLADLLDDGAGVEKRYQVRWSDLNNPAIFSPSVNAEAGFNDLLDDGSPVAWIGVLRDQLAVYKQTAIYLANYVPYPLIFRFEKVGDRGPIGRTVVNLGDRHIFPAEDGFVEFDGMQYKPVGDPAINKQWKLIADFNAADRFRAHVDQAKDEAVWLFVSTASEDGNPNMAITYNYRNEAWSIRELPVWALGTAREIVTVTAATFDALTGTIDQQNVRVGELGIVSEPTAVLIVGGTDKKVYRVSRSFDLYGQGYWSYVDSGELDFGDPGQVKDFWAIRPIFDKQDGYDQELIVGLLTKMDPDDDWTAGTSYAVHSANNREIPIRRSGRFAKLRFGSFSASTGFSLSGFEIDFTAAGRL